MDDRWQAFYGPNAGYALELYERYQQDPNSVDAATRAVFDRLSAGGAVATLAPPPANGARREDGGNGAGVAAPASGVPESGA
ncbi:MAG: hypothetical protein M3Q65_11415, partial [Chloroflexota bacterium]|nr:hypothetical protein [Chloroflexota bacterium]